MARRRELDGTDLVPPAAVQVSFVADGLLDTGGLAAAQMLGVQEYVVDNLLDRLESLDLDERTGRPSWSLSGGCCCGSSDRNTAWRRLATTSSSSIRPVSSGSSPVGPRRATLTEIESAGSGAERRSSCPSPVWPLGSGHLDLAFGDDWADWLVSGVGGEPTSKIASTRKPIGTWKSCIPATTGCWRLRQKSYRSFLEPRCGTRGGLRILRTMSDSSFRATFLLRLGVWEVPPVDVFVDRIDRASNRMPWPGPQAERLERWVQKTWRLAFGYADYVHQKSPSAKTSD